MNGECWHMIDDGGDVILCSLAGDHEVHEGGGWVWSEDEHPKRA